ncbi:MAG: ribonuclease P protein component [Clostridia bacterium]|nr:ribonuclease P protein component [Clostridia bacterium]
MYCFKKLKLNSDFRRIYGRGKSLVAPAFVAYAFKGRTANVRLGITVTKKIGGAVERNRAKRLLTAAFYEVAGDISSGWEFVLVARTKILKTKSQDIAFTLREFFLKEGIMKKDA